MATLGDVPGLDDLLPSTTSLLPSDYSVMQVDSNGSVLGDVTSGMSGGDPFSVTFGFGDEPSGEGGEGEWPAPGANDPMTSTYLPSYSSDDSSSDGSVGSFSGEQLENARTIMKVGKTAGASQRDIQIALMTAIVESGLKNVNYGDRDSLGLFQQRDAWGSAEDRTDPARAAMMFFTGGKGGQRGLLDIEDRKNMGAGEAAQAVQVSAFPERYAEHEAEAQELLAAAAGGTRTRGSYAGKGQYDLTEYDGKTVDNMTAAALDAASKALGSNFHIMQGSHNAGGVQASGGTHDGGGVIDLAPQNGDWEGAVEALRKIGFAAWIRNMDGHGSAGSGAHIHAVLIGNAQLSPQAATQVNSYLHDDDGLAGSAPDDGPRQFVNNRFIWGEATKPDKRTGVERWRHSIVREAQKFIGTPFKWGGEDHEGMDDGGFLRATFRQLGVELPKTTDLFADVEAIPIESVKPGDLIAYGDLSKATYGIYLGKGRFIEAGGPGRVVQLNELGESAANAVGIPMANALRRADPAQAQGLNRPPFQRVDDPKYDRLDQRQYSHVDGDPFTLVTDTKYDQVPDRQFTHVGQTKYTHVDEPQYTHVEPEYTHVEDTHYTHVPKPKPANEGPLQNTTFTQKPKPEGA